MRLIDADALKEIIVSNVYPVADDFNSRDYGMFWTGGIEKAIDDAPTIDERKTGNWIELDFTEAWDYKCDQCGRRSDFRDNFCPNCGADMRGGNNETIENTD